MRQAGGGRGSGASRPLALVLAAAVVLVLLALGSWQLQRLSWKNELMATAARHLEEAPLSPAGLMALPEGEREWRPVRANGRLLGHASFALYRAGTGGRPGYRILTPLALADGSHVLVERGWTQAASFAAALASLPPVPQAPVEMEGVTRLPEAPGPFANPNDPASGAWYWIEIDRMAAAAGVGLLPLVIAVCSDPAGAALDAIAARPAFSNRHLEYALTWYGLAAGAAVVFFLRLRRGRGSGA